MESTTHKGTALITEAPVESALRTPNVWPALEAVSSLSTGETLRLDQIISIDDSE